MLGAGRPRAGRGTTWSALEDMTAALAGQPPSALAIHGGDGTLHKT